MRISIRLIFSLILASSFLLTESTLTSAETERQTIDQETIDQMSAFHMDHGVPLETVKALEAKMANGRLPDALLAEDPVSQNVKETATHDVFIESYADGSIAVSQISRTPASFAGTLPMNIGGCTFVDGSTYHAEYINCEVSHSFAGVRTMDFLFDVTQYNGGQGTLDRYYAAQCEGLGSVDHIALSRISSSQARLNCIFSTAGVGSTALWIQANQGVGNSMFKTHN